MEPTIESLESAAPPHATPAQHPHLRERLTAPVAAVGERAWTAITAHHLGGIAKAFGFVAVVAWFLFATIVVVLRYVVLPNVDGYRESIERAASNALGESVKIGEIDAAWRGLRPTLVLHAVRIVDREGRNTLELPAIRATLSWQSLVVMNLRLASLEIDAPDLAIRRAADGQLFVAGLAIRRRTTPDSKVGEWVLAQDEIRVRRARIAWRDEMRPADARGATEGTDLVFTDVDFVIRRSAWKHRVALRATPPAALAAPIDLRAEIAHPLFATHLADPATWSGQLYADIATGDVAAWRAWLPLPETIDGGRGRVRAWVRFTDAASPAGTAARQVADAGGKPVPAEIDRLAEVTADLALDEVGVHWGAGDRVALSAIDGRLAARQDANAQSLVASKLAFRMKDGAALVPTDLRIERTLGRRPEDEAGKATLSGLDVGTAIALVPAAMLPPAVEQKIVAYRPRGVLSALTFQWTGPAATPQTFRFDGRFDRLAIAAQPPTPEAIAAASKETIGPNGLVRKPRPAFGQPGFENFSGTLSATRSLAGGVAATQASVQIRAPDLAIEAPGLFDEPTLRFARFDADVTLKVQGADTELQVERATFENPDLAGNAKVTFRRGPKSGSEARGWIDLDAHLTRADVARVPRYLPNVIGEKARIYLRKSLLGGRVVDANLRMHGALEKLDLRAQPGALATPYAVSLPEALTAERDTKTTPAVPALNGTPARAAGNDEAIFHALIRVQNATYLYGPARTAEEAAASPSHIPGTPALPSVAWPVFEDVDADIVFDQARMVVLARSARVFNFKLDHVRAELPALADPAHVLRVVGRGKGPMQDLVRFVNASPVATWTRHFSDNTQATGDAGFALALDLPLTHARDAEVFGSVQLAGNDLALNAVIPAMKRLSGRVDFSDKGLMINGVTGQALGGPLRIDAATRNDGYIELNVDGTLDARALRAGDSDATSPGSTTGAAIQRAASRFDGTARYAVALRVRSKRMADATSAATGLGAKAKADVVVESNLAGLAIDLPPPFTKTAAESWPLRIEIDRTMAPSAPGVGATVDAEETHVTLANRVAASITRRRDAQGRLAVTRAAYAVGDNVALADGASGLRIDVPELDLDAWRDVAKQVGAAKASQGSDPAPGGFDRLVPDRIDLKAKEVRVANRSFGNVVLDARRSPSGWQGNVDADQIAGQLSYLDVNGKATGKGGIAAAGSGRLVARLSRLSIPQGETSGAHVERALDASRQKEFPAIDLVAERFELRGRPMGRLEVVAENVGDDARREWQLEKLGLTMPEATFKAHGVWGHAGTAEDTRLDFSIDASDVGAVLERFGLKNTVKNGTARLAGNAAWSGGPTTIDFASMEGRMRLEADKGQFLKAEPGIAKLLNVLSLQGLPRRLMFDFSDVFEKGFAFDTIRADANIVKGVAHTDNFTMQGVQATVRMSGTADFERETADLHVLVLPEINAGAASLGAALVNPAIGLATFVAQYLFKDSISRALSFEYNVKGPWKKPEVTKIDHDGNETPVVPKGTTASREGASAQE